jgi:beta-N-acetylhexosaminidase
MTFKKIVSFLLCIASFVANAQSFVNPNNVAANNWVDSVFEKLTTKQRIAQLMMIRVHSNKDAAHIASVAKLIKKYNVGSLCFFQGGPIRQAVATNYFQEIAKTPLLIAMDAEWGVGMRLDSVVAFKRQLMMGAMQDTMVSFLVGKAIGQQCNLLGIHYNLAPVVDVNNNANNPVINDRSFGENASKVASLAGLYIEGLQQQNVLACAKHFPGHGDVAVDSHLDLPIINKTLNELNDVELYPFSQLINQGVASVMLAHLSIPALDSAKNLPSSLSSKIVTNLLKNKMNFKGIAITDALEMKALSKFFSANDAALLSLMAGNDMICLPSDVAGSIAKVAKAIKQKKLSQEAINQSVKKVLFAKYYVGLSKKTIIDTTNITEKLNQNTNKLNQQIANNAITLLKQNNPNILPLTAIMGNKDMLPRVAYIAIGDSSETVFAKQMKANWQADIYYFNNAKKDTLLEKIEPSKGNFVTDTRANIDAANAIINSCFVDNKYDVIVVGLHSFSRRPSNNFNLGAAAIYLANKLGNNNNTLSLVFGNPYAIKNLCTASNIICCYEDDPTTQLVAANMLLGKQSPIGRLPVSVCDSFKAGSGIIKLNSFDKKKL